MRVLMTTDTIGGVWTFTRELATELLDRGHDVGLISFGRKPSAGQQAWASGTVEAYGTRFSYQPSDAPLEWMQENDRAYDDAARLIESTALLWRPEILLTSQFCFGAASLDVPKVVVAHSDVLSWAQACRHEALPSTAWIETYKDLVQRGLNGATAVVAPTRWMLNALAANFDLPLRKKMIANGCTVRSTATLSRKKLQAITAGRFWDEGKNLAMLQNLDLPLPVLVAGDTGGSSSTSLCHLGEVSDVTMRELMRESSIYLCTSKYEPFGLAPLEAALCGCAVVANDLASLREVWRDDALYFRDEATLLTRLRELTLPGKLEEAQRRSERRALLFGAARMAKSYLHLFEQLVHQYSERGADAA